MHSLSALRLPRGWGEVLPLFFLYLWSKNMVRLELVSRTEMGGLLWLERSQTPTRDNDHSNM